MNDIDESVHQSDLVHEQLRRSTFKRWVLLDGNRFTLAAILSWAVFIIVVGIGLAGYIPVSDPATATTLVGAIVGGTLPFITIVLAINQLVLSQELGGAGELMDRFEQMSEFRREVENITASSVSPAAPAEFLQHIVENIISKTTEFYSQSSNTTNGELSDLVNDFREAVLSEGEDVTEALDDADFGTFDALSSVLGHYNGAHRHAARTIQAKHAEDLSTEALDTLETLIKLFGYLAVARQTFKTLYMQHELANLSLLLLYVGLPTLLGGGIFMMIYQRIINTVNDPISLVVIVSIVITFVFLPFIILLVYTFRIATIASRTADFGPFVPRVDLEE